MAPTSPPLSMPVAQLPVLPPSPNRTSPRQHNYSTQRAYPMLTPMPMPADAPGPTSSSPDFFATLPRGRLHRPAAIGRPASVPSAASGDQTCLGALPAASTSSLLRPAAPGHDHDHDHDDDRENECGKEKGKEKEKGRGLLRWGRRAGRTGGAAPVTEVGKQPARPSQSGKQPAPPSQPLHDTAAPNHSADNCSVCVDRALKRAIALSESEFQLQQAIEASAREEEERMLAESVREAEEDRKWREAMRREEEERSIREAIRRERQERLHNRHHRSTHHRADDESDRRLHAREEEDFQKALRLSMISVPPPRSHHTDAPVSAYPSTSQPPRSSPGPVESSARPLTFPPSSPPHASSSAAAGLDSQAALQSRDPLEGFDDLRVDDAQPSESPPPYQSSDPSGPPRAPSSSARPASPQPPPVPPKGPSASVLSSSALPSHLRPSSQCDAPSTSLTASPTADVDGSVRPIRPLPPPPAGAPTQGAFPTDVLGVLLAASALSDVPAGSSPEPRASETDEPTCDDSAYVEELRDDEDPFRDPDSDEDYSPWSETRPNTGDASPAATTASFEQLPHLTPSADADRRERTSSIASASVSVSVLASATLQSVEPTTSSLPTEEQERPVTASGTSQDASASVTMESPPASTLDVTAAAGLTSPDSTAAAGDESGRAMDEGLHSQLAAEYGPESTSASAARVLSCTRFSYARTPFTYTSPTSTPLPESRSGSPVVSTFPSVIYLSSSARAEAETAETGAGVDPSALGHRYFCIATTTWRNLLSTLTYFGNTRIEGAAREIAEAEGEDLRLGVELEFSPHFDVATGGAIKNAVNLTGKEGNPVVGLCLSLAQKSFLARHPDGPGVPRTVGDSNRKFVSLPRAAPALPMTLTALVQHLHAAHISSAACPTTNMSAYYSSKALAVAIDKTGGGGFDLRDEPGVEGEDEGGMMKRLKERVGQRWAKKAGPGRGGVDEDLMFCITPWSVPEDL